MEKRITRSIFQTFPGLTKRADEVPLESKFLEFLLLSVVAGFQLDTAFCSPYSILDGLMLCYKVAENQV